MEVRKRHINELEQMVKINKNLDQTVDILAKSFMAKSLNNVLTREYCNVVECIYNGDIDSLGNGWVRGHVHEESQEVFYQILGETSFNDGTTIKSGEFKIIPKGVSHMVKMEEGSVAIVIIHPPIKELERLT